MALTFGTLLSSQGAEAHRPDPFGPIRGNLVYVTRSVSHGQHGPAPPGGAATWSGRLASSRHPSASGGSARPHPGLALRRGPALGLRVAEKSNTSEPPGGNPNSPIDC